MINIIELAKKAARETDPDFVDFDPPERAVAGLERFAALYRQALINSGELVPAEKVKADAVDAERYRWLCADMPVSDEADARYRVLQRMDMMGKGAIDSEIDNWRIK